MFVICKAVVKAAIRLPVLMYTTHMYIYTLTHNVVAQNRIVSLRIVLCRSESYCVAQNRIAVGC